MQELQELHELQPQELQELQPQELHLPLEDTDKMLILLPLDVLKLANVFTVKFELQELHELHELQPQELLFSPYCEA